MTGPVEFPKGAIQTIEALYFSCLIGADLWEWDIDMAVIRRRSDNRIVQTPQGLMLKSPSAPTHFVQWYHIPDSSYESLLLDKGSLYIFDTYDDVLAVQKKYWQSTFKRKAMWASHWTSDA